jgi:hypothetical protein
MMVMDHMAVPFEERSNILVLKDLREFNIKTIDETSFVRHSQDQVCNI